MRVTTAFRKMRWLMNINEECLVERRSTENIEKVGLTYFLNLFRVVVSYSHLAIVIGFCLVVVNSRMICSM